MGWCVRHWSFEGLSLLMPLACAGTTYVVDDDGGTGADFMRIHAAVDAAYEGDSIEVRGRSYV
ncbi:MAG: hypothetical protein C5S48_08725 [Candidatus Methanogaster sp.]|nr:MAG: hypothetical protein C5S48_08725 [ANME-2 cluster archaeon]